MEIPYTRRTLANGLDVIVHRDPRLPMVAVNVWYHVGSKDERPGLTGLAHLFEHLMFEGSAHHDRGYFLPLQQAGALVNGSTNADRTNYWEVVPAGALELALWMESDRMGNLLPALTAAKFATQRDVVLNERRQNYENRPYGLSGVVLAAALFPPAHPYHWITIGAPGDVRAATIDDARAFFETYYHPSNASLALAGDLDAGQAFDLADRYFGDIPGRPAPHAPDARLDTLADQRLVLEDRVELPRLVLAWRSPAMFAPGDAELDLAADLVAHGKTSRLYQALVYERRIATDVDAMQHSRELCGTFQVSATAAPGVPLGDLAAIVDETVADLAADGPTADERARAAAQIDAQFLYRVQTIGGFGGKSDQLNAYNVFRDDPGYFVTDRRRYERATTEGIAAAVRNATRGRPRVALSVVPAGGRALALPGSMDVRAS